MENQLEQQQNISPECRYCHRELDTSRYSSEGLFECKECGRKYMKVNRLENSSVMGKREAVKNRLAERMKNFLQVEEDYSVRCSEINQLKRKNTLQQEEIETYLTREAQPEKYVKGLDEASEELIHLQGEIDKLSSENEELRRENDQYGESTDRQKIQFETLNKENACKSVTLSATMNDFSTIKSEFSELEKTNQELNEKVSHLTIELDNVRRSLGVIPDLEMEVDTSRNELKDLQKEMIDIRTRQGATREFQLEKDLMESRAWIQQLEKKVENFELESEVNTEDMGKAQSEISALNSLLEEAFFHNEKKSEAEKFLQEKITKLEINQDNFNSKELDQKDDIDDEVKPKNSGNLVDMARKIEEKEENLKKISLQVDKKVDFFLENLGRRCVTENDFLVLRKNHKTQFDGVTIFPRGTLLPEPGMTMECEFIYSVNSMKKGQNWYVSKQGDVSRIICKAFINFASNLKFFLNEKEWKELVLPENRQFPVEIREVFSLDSDGKISVSYFRNGGYKWFKFEIGKVETEEDFGLKNVSAVC